jgi:hypothetical protein
MESHHMVHPLTITPVMASGSDALRVDIGSGTAILDARDVDALIERLALIRSSMKPALPPQPSRTKQHVVEIDPCWYVDRSPLFDGVVLLLRHTGLGWTGFAIPRESLERLNRAMAERVLPTYETNTLRH